MARGGSLFSTLVRCAGLCGLLACVATFVPALAAEHAPLPESAPEAQGYSAPRLQRLHAFMDETTGADGYLGGISLIARNGRIIDWHAYGYRDLARSQPLRRDDIFRIYSMSKTVTSVAVLMLMEEGKFALDDSISRYLPGFDAPQVVTGGSVEAPRLRPAARPITIRHLLTHTAGFAAGRPGDDIALALLQRTDPHAAGDLRGFVERLSRVPLAADPGTRFGYDGAALETLARLVEVSSGLSFDVFLRQRVFAPLRMRDTGFSVPAAQRARVVDITRMSDDGRLRLDDGPSAREPGAPLNTYPSGAGGLYSTAGDYLRFCQMLLAGGSLDGETLLGRKTVELMMRNHLTMLNPPVTQFSDAEGFGLGGYVVLDPALRGQPGSVGQFGWSGAASTSYTVDPQERLIAILLLQHLPREDRADLPRVARRFYGLVYQGLAP